MKGKVDECDYQINVSSVQIHKSRLSSLPSQRHQAPNKVHQGTPFKFKLKLSKKTHGPQQSPSATQRNVGLQFFDRGKSNREQSLPQISLERVKQSKLNSKHPLFSLKGLQSLELPQKFPDNFPKQRHKIKKISNKNPKLNDQLIDISLQNNNQSSIHSNINTQRLLNASLQKSMKSNPVIQKGVFKTSNKKDMDFSIKKKAAYFNSPQNSVQSAYKRCQTELSSQVGQKQQTLRAYTEAGINALDSVKDYSYLFDKSTQQNLKKITQIKEQEEELKKEIKREASLKSQLEYNEFVDDHLYEQTEENSSNFEETELKTLQNIPQKSQNLKQQLRIQCIDQYNRKYNLQKNQIENIDFSKLSFNQKLAQIRKKQPVLASVQELKLTKKYQENLNELKQIEKFRTEILKKDLFQGSQLEQRMYSLTDRHESQNDINSQPQSLMELQKKYQNQLSLQQISDLYAFSNKSQIKQLINTMAPHEKQQANFIQSPKSQQYSNAPLYFDSLQPNKRGSKSNIYNQPFQNIFKGKDTSEQNQKKSPQFLTEHNSQSNKNETIKVYQELRTQIKKLVPPYGNYIKEMEKKKRALNAKPLESSWLEKNAHLNLFKDKKNLN